MDFLNALSQLPLTPAIIATAVLVVFVLKYWKTIKRLIKDTKQVISELNENRYAAKINPTIENSFLLCKTTERLLQAYRDFMPLAYRFDRKAPAIRIELKPGRAIAIIPVSCMDSIVEATHLYTSTCLSEFSVVRDCKKIQKAMDVFVVLLLIKNSGLDGSLKIAMERFFNKVKEDREMAIILDVLGEVNDMLKNREANLDPRLIRILLIEACGAELQ